MSNDFRNRLKRLENINSSTLDCPVFIDLLDNGKRKIYTNINGKIKVFTEDEWLQREALFVKNGDRTMIFIDDVLKND